MNEIMQQKLQTAAFSGHRNVDICRRSETAAKLDVAVEQAYGAGIRRFLCGMAQGFDLMAAGAVIRFREEHPDVRLVAVLPFRQQRERMSPGIQQYYDYVMTAADEQVVLSEFYYKDCLLRRNDYLLAKSSTMIIYYDGGYRGGTCYTYNRARKFGLRITNLF